MTDEKTAPKYRIKVDAYGGLEVEAPTKGETIELFHEVSKTKKDSPIGKDVV